MDSDRATNHLRSGSGTARAILLLVVSLGALAGCAGSERASAGKPETSAESPPPAGDTVMSRDTAHGDSLMARDTIRIP
jgi:hypothetical protein